MTVTGPAAETVDAAEVLILRGARTLATARTTSDGTARLVVATDTGAVDIAVRKIGFRPQARFVRPAAGETTVVSIRLVRAVQQLDDVRVSALESARRRSYYLDAETIAGSNRPVRSALDAIAALRPDMLTSRGGWRVCGTIKEVWVNGRRIRQNVDSDPMLRNRRLPGVSPKAPVPPAVLAILNRIRPEHIAEMTYIDCFGGAVRKLGSENAVLVVLKPGVDFQWPTGSFVPADTAPSDRRR